MKILSISTDRKIFESDSAVRARMLRQARLVERMDVIVFSFKKSGLQKFADGNLTAYPTNSFFRFLYAFNAVVIGLFLGKPDLITVQDPFETALAGLLLKMLKRTRLQVQIHTDFLNPYFSKNSALNGFRAWLSKFFIPRADRVRTVSERVKKSLEENFKKHPPIDVLPVHTDLAFFSGGRSSRGNLSAEYPEFGFFILSVARLEKEKNIELTLRVFKKICEKIPNAALIILGDGSEKESLILEAKRMGVGEKVKFIGWRKNTASYYRSSNLLLCTSDYEGYGMVFVEAASLLCPIVASDVGIMGETFRNGEEALVCPVGDEKCFVESVTKISQNPDLAKDLANSAFNAAHKHIISADEYFERMLDIWEKCLS